MNNPVDIGEFTETIIHLLQAALKRTYDLSIRVGLTMDWYEASDVLIIDRGLLPGVLWEV